jgi:polyisoprenoid-binding protein YceI
MMVRYTLDAAQSRFTVQAFASGLLSGFGHSPTFAIREFTGELRFAPDAPGEASFSLTVKADSLKLPDAVSPEDRDEIENRMRQEVLETASYPEIVFQSTQITTAKIADGWYRLQLAAELRLHGVKKPHAVDAQLRLSEDQARLSGQCTLLLSAYRIRPVSALGGMIKLKDELKFDFDIVGRKQER